MLGNDGVHLLGGTDDGIDRAGLDAQRAADAGVLVDDGDLLGFLFGVERFDLAAEQVSQTLYALDATRRALVDFVAVGNGLGVGLATWVSRRSRVTGPTPQSRPTGSGCRKASSSPGTTTVTPSPAWTPCTEARGLASWEASLARNLLGATPTEQVRCSWSNTARRMSWPAAAPVPHRRMAPVRSRKASSSDSGSTSGVYERNSSMTRPLTSL